MNSTVAIVGSHTHTRDAAPWNSPNVDIWLFNESVSIGWPKRCDAIFQMHARPVWRNPLNRNDPNYRKWLRRKHPFPIYMQERYGEVPSSVRFPLDEIGQTLLPGLCKGEASGKPYFTSSVSYALALAIHLQYSRIELYGVEMESDTEYRYQRDGVFFWIGVALGRGVEVVVHPESNFFKEPLYGYEGDVTLTRKHFEERLQLLTRVRADAETALERANQMQAGALDAAASGNGDQDATRRYFASIKAQTNALIDLGMFEGAIQEENRYIHKADEMDKAAGKHIFARQEFELTAAQAGDIKAQRQAHMNVLGGQAQAAWKALQGAIESQVEQAALEALSLAYAGAHENYLKAAFEFGRLSGIVQENITLLDKCDALVKAAGGERAESVLLEAAAKPKKNGRYHGRKGKRHETVVEPVKAG